MPFRVRGTDRKSGLPFNPLNVEAANERAALAEAAGAGMLVEGFEPLPPPSPQYPAIDTSPSPAGKYPAMVTLAWWYRFLAVVCGIAAIIGFMSGIVATVDNPGIGLAVAASSVVWGALTVVSLLALAEGIGLMMDIEVTLRQIRDRIAMSGEPGIDGAHAGRE